MAELLGFPVVEINAKNKDGFDELLSTVKKVANKHIDTTDVYKRQIIGNTA